MSMTPGRLLLVLGVSSRTCACPLAVVNCDLPQVMVPQGQVSNLQATFCWRRFDNTGVPKAVAGIMETVGTPMVI